MKKDKSLKEMYPWLIVRNRWNGEIIEVNDKNYTELDNMPLGWKRAFGKKMCKEIDRVLRKANYQNNYRILEIKEKYGSLRWYTNALPKKIFKKHEKILRKYEKISAHTCVICGKRCKIINNNGWLEPICKKCKKVLN